MEPRWQRDVRWYKGPNVCIICLHARHGAVEGKDRFPVGFRDYSFEKSSWILIQLSGWKEFGVGTVALLTPWIYWAVRQNLSL